MLRVQVTELSRSVERLEQAVVRIDAVTSELTERLAVFRQDMHQRLRVLTDDVTGIEARLAACVGGSLEVIVWAKLTWRSAASTSTAWTSVD